MAGRSNPTSLLERAAATLDRVVGVVSPGAQLRRMRQRDVLAYYEAARPSQQRRFARERLGPNGLVDQGAHALRDQARHLDRNHDITRGALNTLVECTIGPQGIGVEFQPRRADGTIHREYSQALALAWADFCVRPEVTRKHHMSKVQRLVQRTRLRDGEVFSQVLRGQVDWLKHGGRVPLSIELLEPDFVPLDKNDPANGIRQGAQLDAWGRVTGWHVHRSHPLEGVTLGVGLISDTKLIPAERMIHYAGVDRIGQLRGVSELASVITRIEDLKDYEESERIAAKIAAMLTAYVKRQAPEGEGYTPEIDAATGQPKPRALNLSPGTIIDTLAVGEEIGMLDSKRPNPNVVSWRVGQLRAFAAGIGANASTVSRSYEGSFSAQRQELVESYVRYAVMTDDFVGSWLDPVVQNFIALVNLSRVVPMPRDVLPLTNDDVLYVAPSMPWIDPLKEATAWVTLSNAGLASEVEGIRRRGQSPASVIAQRRQWIDMHREAGLPLPAAHPAALQDPAAADAVDEPAGRNTAGSTAGGQ